MKKTKYVVMAIVSAMTFGTLSVAHAAPMTVALTVNAAAPATAGTSSTTAVALPVPADNSVDATDALKFVATVDAGTSVSVVATNATIVTDLATVAAPVTSTSGTGTLTVSTGTGTTATFYVYTKTTAIGTVAVTNGGTTLTYYVQGTAGKINTLVATAPTSAPASTQQTVTVAATDVFGNKVSGKSITGRVFGGQGTLDTVTATTGATLSDFGTATFKLTLPTTGRALVEFSLTTATDGASALTGFNTPSVTPYVEVTVRDLAAELKAAQDALAAEKAARAADKTAADAAATKAASDLASAKADLAKAQADAVTAKAAADKALANALADAAKAKADSDATLKTIKDAFNALATKWNAKNPKAKVATLK